MAEDFQFHFPSKVELSSSPLQEAWLTIKWNLETSGEGFRDPIFPLALGRFDHLVKEKFPFRTELPIAQAPSELTPYLARFQFRKNGPEGWPLLQIGPGIATVNFMSPCSWESFKEGSLFLRDALIQSYQEVTIPIQSLTLTYRNGIPFEYSKKDVLTHLKTQLNTEISLPKYLPGVVAEKKHATNLSLGFAFDLCSPEQSKGTLKIASGTKKENEKLLEYLVFDTQVNSESSLPDINSEEFSRWLDQAHSVCHEWFMALVDGNLIEQYTRKKKE